MCNYKILISIIGLGVLVSVTGYEVLEGRYTGEKYEATPDASAHFEYSSAHRGSPSSLPVPQNYPSTQEDQSEGRSSMGLFSTLVKQLSSVLHHKIVGTNQGSSGGGSEVGQVEGRSLSPAEGETEAKSEDGELYYHYYPSNQHLFNLPECATQQVCNAVYIRLNFTQPLCACPALSDPCSASYLSNDQHTIELKMGNAADNAITLVKTCEPVWSVRECRTPRDWAILALQNTRTGKAHYLVICKCANSGKLDGPLNHDQPTYAQVPGIRVYGMMCNTDVSRTKRDTHRTEDQPPFPWWRIKKALEAEGVLQDLIQEENSQTLTHTRDLTTSQAHETI
ncbi:UNVERIFIED_CONTAM: hypothetical protein RMT77_000591 [Armadillidium vulgare]